MNFSIEHMIEENEDSLGLIVGMNDEKKLIFAHKTYEEFFAASWLAKNRHSHTNLVTVLFQEKHTNTLTKGSPVHLAILYRNLDVLAMNEDQIENCNDKLSWNAFHYADETPSLAPIYLMLKRVQINRELLRNHSISCAVL
jgi:hypothetical protein